MKFAGALFTAIRLLLFFTPPFLSAQSSTAEPTVVTLSGRAMGTTWSAKFITPDPPSSALDPNVVTARISATLEQLESVFSTYRADSELSRFNDSSSNDWFPVSNELARVATQSQRISELTTGAYDVTVEPLVRLWGFGPQRRLNSVPTEVQLAAARTRVDYQHLGIRLSPPALRKGIPELSADFSSMAKGYAADALSALLTTLGASDNLAQIGGDIKTSGSHPWRTAIAQPALPVPSAGDARLPLALARIVALAGFALSTSGNAHNFTTLGNRRYGHIIDPRSGRPAMSALASVSVIHASCAQSSALATALFVLGVDEGYTLAAREHLACLFILRDGTNLTQRTTPEFERFVTSPTAAR